MFPPPGELAVLHVEMPRGAVPQQETFRQEQRLREDKPGGGGRGQVQGRTTAGELYESLHWPRCYLVDYNVICLCNISSLSNDK